jgi:hypothetical protein
MKVTKSLNVVITTIGVEMVVTPNINVVKGGALISFVENLGHGSNIIFVGKTLNRSLEILAITTGIVGTPHMVFTNLIMTIHVNKIINRLLMNSMVVGEYKSINIENPTGGYREPSIITIGIPNHRNDHSIRPNMVALKYLDFKKNVDPNAHVRVFNFEVKANAKTSKKYIINAFRYTLRVTTSD